MKISSLTPVIDRQNGVSRDFFPRTKPFSLHFASQLIECLNEMLVAGIKSLFIVRKTERIKGLLIRHSRKHRNTSYTAITSETLAYSFYFFHRHSPYLTERIIDK